MTAEPLFSLETPPFDWDAPIPGALLVTIATFGDQDMRLAAADSASITLEAAQALLALGDPDVTDAVLANMLTPAAARDYKAPTPRQIRAEVRREARDRRAYARSAIRLHQTAGNPTTEPNRK